MTYDFHMFSMTRVSVFFINPFRTVADVYHLPASVGLHGGFVLIVDRLVD